MHYLLSAFGFSEDRIAWIMKLTSSVFFSILINGVPSKSFSPSRGIHQGDPLSPFIFVIMAKGLGRYLSTSISNGTLQGIPIHGLHPTTSHSQFVDDTMLLNTPMTKEVVQLQTILSYFSEASGTTFNLDKSHLFQHSFSYSKTHLPPPRHPMLLPSVQLSRFTPYKLSCSEYFLEFPSPLSLQSPHFLYLHIPKPPC